jgi:hypothetical protein
MTNTEIYLTTLAVIVIFAVKIWLLEKLSK